MTNKKSTDKRTETHACDLISRQAAIDAVMDEFKRIPTNAIRAKTRIEALPFAQNVPNDNLISRKAAIEAVRAMQTYKMCYGDDLILVDKAGVMTDLMMLPPAQPELANVLGVTCDFLMGTSENRNGIKVQKEPKFGEWTFCDDQMPKDGQIVILKHKFKSDVYGNITIGQYKRGRFVWYGYQSDWDNHTSIVIHGDMAPGNEYVEKWMPLPEPYQEGEQE